VRRRLSSAGSLALIERREMLLSRLIGCALFEAEVARDEFFVDISPGIPELSAWLVDLASFYSNPTFQQLRPKAARSAGTSDGGPDDSPSGSLAGGYAVVSALASRTLSRADIRELCRKSFRALPPGGRLVVVDAMPAPVRSAQRAAWRDLDLLAAQEPTQRSRLSWRVRSPKGATMEFWRKAAADAGFRNVRFLVMSPPMMVMTATRPPAHA
jgi:hypothetical protein